MRGRILVFGLVWAAAVLGGCGGSKTKSVRRVTPSAIDVYSSLPLQGPSATQSQSIVDGIRLALEQAHGRAGLFTINYTSLDDSTHAAGGYDYGQTAANARGVARDAKAVYYIGELNSGASEVSIPILNQAGVPEVSPANTYVGLTVTGPGSASGEPQKYYPSGVRTYLRLVPRDSFQAAADLMAVRQAGCTKLAVANDRTPYGEGLATLIELEKGLYGVTIVSSTAIQPPAASFRSYATKIKNEGADCFLFAGIVAKGGVQITRDVGAALPKAPIFGSDGMCSRSWMRDLPPGIARLIECTVATPRLGASARGRSFLAAWRARYGGTPPDPYAVYGYEAMKLAIDTIGSLGMQGNSKSTVLKALFALRDRHSPIGTYGFDKNGDTTLRSYGLYRAGAGGSLLFVKTLTPPRVL